MKLLKKILKVLYRRIFESGQDLDLEHFKKLESKKHQTRGGPYEN